MQAFNPGAALTTISYHYPKKIPQKRENLPSSPSLRQERRAAAQHRRGGAPISITEESRAGEGILVSTFGV
uniref:Uncharacterized protein n=1 Tax=Oryza barthii TaxID=65489 RepID=A0A0D3F866_9ORYZ